MRNRFKWIFIGAERCGKTFWVKHYAEEYVKKEGTVIAYNFGKDKDFPEYDPKTKKRLYYTIEPLTFSEHIQMFFSATDEKRYYSLNKTVTYFRLLMPDGEDDKIIHFKDFSKVFYKKRVRIPRVQNKAEENQFFKTLFNYVSNTLLILDDCKPMFRHGMKDNQIELFNRSNHTGKRNAIKEFKDKGIDIISIFHNPDHAPEELWDYTTDAFLFYYPMNANYKKMDNPDLAKIFDKSKKYLHKAPKYTSLKIGVQGENYLKVKNVTLKLKSKK